MGLNTDKLRQDFPILSKKIVYFDNSCVTLRPRQVVEAMNRYYYEFPACAGRSMHRLGNKITGEVELSRKQIQKFIGAKSSDEIIFTRNTTEAINLVAKSFAFKRGDKVLISDKEHNSNLLPWQVLSEKGVIKLEIVNSNPDNTLDMADFEKKVDGARLVSIVHTSNIDGVTNPAREMIGLAHRNGALVMLDAAQSVPHKEVDVKNLGVDFLAFSGHKMLGPSGIGAFYGKKALLESLEPFIVGGETVKDVHYDSREWEDLPHRFEAGLQNYAGIIGFAEAARYLGKIGLSNIEKHEQKLTEQIAAGMEKIGNITILGPGPKMRGGITSFNLKSANPHDIALLMDHSAGVMMRSGAHCVHAWFNKHNLPGTARASLYLYNTPEEVDYFLEHLRKIKPLLH